MIKSYSKICCLTLAIAGFGFIPTSLIAQERIWVPAAIEGKPVRLIFDTAASRSVLYRRTVERLGLKSIDPNSTNRANPQITYNLLEPFNFSLWGNSFRTRFYEVNFPNSLSPDGDGLLGWGMVRDNLFWIDMEFNFMSPLREIPEICEHWPKFQIPRDAEILALSYSNDGRTNSIVLDTGSLAGVALAPKKWEQWMKDNRGSPTTLRATVSLGEGLTVGEEVWAKTLEIGPLSLKNVPICKASADQLSFAPGFEALVGAQALKQMILAVDGEKDVAYVGIKQRPPQPYNHNRLGAVFIPKDLQSTNLIAHVASKSPAEKSGVKNGDILLKINNLDVALWQSNPEIRNSLRDSFASPAGTKLRLELQRGTDVTNIVVTLRDIIGPRSTVNAKVISLETQ